MSSSNLVEINFIEETVLGETPGAGNFSTARFISEALSGTPETTESAQIRSDRLTSGQVVVGLTVGGELSFELAKEPEIDDFIESAMLSTFATSGAVTVDLTIDTTLKTITRAAGDFTLDLNVGDFISLTNFANAENNVQVMVTEVTSATVIKYTGPEGMVDEAGSETDYKLADKISIGTTKKSFSMIKKFIDLTNKAINYRGMLVNTMNLNVAYGEIVNGSFGFSGVDYDPVDAAVDFMTNGRTINAPSTTQSMNGSIDMPVIASSSVGTLDGVTFCIQNVELALANNLTAQQCIGKAAPKDYSPGSAGITVNLSAYLADDNWSIIKKKLTQESFALGFQVKNGDGWYGFYMPAVQVSFDDPASGGANQDVILSMSGTAKVGANGESSLYIYKS